jgi:hypothetical protein
MLLSAPMRYLFLALLVMRLIASVNAQREIADIEFHQSTWENSAAAVKS